MNSVDNTIDILEALTRLPEERPQAAMALRSCIGTNSNFSRRWTI
jgi:hypothetical protein